jgi:hypothetical protein
MGNCTGIIYGLVTSSTDGSPISNVYVSLNWVQRAEGGPLKVGGNDDLTKWVPDSETTKAGEYVIPFYWAPEQVPGDVASALAMWYYAGNLNDRISMNKHGQVGVGLDVKKLIGVVAPPIPASGSSAASMFLKFYIAATPELKGMSILTRFVGTVKLISAELQGCYSRIDFQL